MYAVSPSTTRSTGSFALVGVSADQSRSPVVVEYPFSQGSFAVAGAPATGLAATTTPAWGRRSTVPSVASYGGSAQAGPTWPWSDTAATSWPCRPPLTIRYPPYGSGE